MGGFVAIDGTYIDAYSVNYVKDGHKSGTAEMMLACGKMVYSNLGATETVQMLITARAECEGRS